MLNQPLAEKLLAMRLQGMVEALKTQEQDRAVNELSFLERLSLLVDQQWSWRENQALARRLKSGQIERAGLRGGHRLPGGAWPGQDGDACSSQRLCLGPQSREHFRAGSVRRGQELSRFGPGAESLS
jgi:hypothetical protein